MTEDMRSFIGVVIGVTLLALFAICVLFPSLGGAVVSAIWNAIVWFFTVGN